MSSTTNEVKLKLLYGDSTTRTYTIPVDNEEHLNNVKSRIIQINKHDQTVPESVQAYYSDMQYTFVSDKNYHFTKITSGQIVITEEDVIYDANS